MRWKVGPVQDTADDRNDFAGSGFSIVDEAGRPIVTFGYSDPATTREAGVLIAKALIGTKLVAAH